jgi:hypothetical protein
MRNSAFVLMLLVAGCGLQLRSGYTAASGSCTCVGVDGGTLTVPISYGVTECEVPAEKVRQDCESSVVAFETPTLQDAGCASNASCPCEVFVAAGHMCN